MAAEEQKGKLAVKTRVYSADYDDQDQVTTYCTQGAPKQELIHLFIQQPDLFLENFVFQHKTELRFTVLKIISHQAFITIAMPALSLYNKTVLNKLDALFADLWQ